MVPCFVTCRAGLSASAELLVLLAVVTTRRIQEFLKRNFYHCGIAAIIGKNFAGFSSHLVCGDLRSPNAFEFATKLCPKCSLFSRHGTCRLQAGVCVRTRCAVVEIFQAVRRIQASARVSGCTSCQVQMRDVRSWTPDDEADNCTLRTNNALAF